MFASSSSSFVHLLLLWLLAIIEGGGFTCSLTVRLLRVAKQSGAHILVTMQGHIVKLEMASNFTRFLAMKTCHPTVVAVAVRGAALVIFGPKQLLLTAWQRLLPNRRYAKSPQIPPNFCKKRATSSGASQKFRPSESLILTMQRVNCTN